MSSEKRKYELRARAERQAETRQRIAAATAALHEEVGPARTTVAEIARRAGVQRLTVYNNFRDEHELLAACQRHFLEQHPPPDLAAAFATPDPASRLQTALREVYGWYRRTGRMSENVQRDRELLPALDALLRETSDPELAAVAEELVRGFATAKPPRTVRAAIALALDFWTWRRLSGEGLDDETAAGLMTAAVTAAATASSRRRRG